MNAPDPIPEPVPITEAEALVFLRTVARLHGGVAVRLYQGGFPMIERARPPARILGLAALQMGGPQAWHDRPAWIFDCRTNVLCWRAPNVLAPGGWVSWRGIDDPGAP